MLLEGVILGAVTGAIWGYFARRGVPYNPQKELGPIGNGIVSGITGGIYGLIAGVILSVLGFQITATDITLTVLRPLYSLGGSMVIVIILVVAAICLLSLVQKRKRSVLSAFVLANLFIFATRGGFDNVRSELEVAQTTPTPTPTFAVTATHTPSPAPTFTRRPTRTPTPSPTPTPRPNVIVNSDTLNLRAGPSTTEKILGTLKRGELLEVLSATVDGEWLEVRRPAVDTVGWVSSLLVDMVGAVNYEEELTSANNQDKPRIYYTWASQLRVEGRYDTAVEVYKTLIEEHPFSRYAALALLNLGNVYQGQGKAADAEEAYRAALKADSNLVEAVVNLGSLFYSRGDVDLAIEQFERALRVDPNSVAAHINLSVVYGEQGQFESAIAQLQQALKIAPGSAKAHYNLGWIYDAQGQWDAAVKEYQAALAINSDYAKAYAALAVTYSKLGRDNLADAEFKKAVAIDPALANSRVSTPTPSPPN